MHVTSMVETAFNAPLDPEIFREPIEFMLAEHYRQLVFCNTLDAIVANPRHGHPRADLEAILDYLEADLPAHVADEEEDLFPMLARRCTAADNFAEIVAVLKREHTGDWALVETIQTGLIELIGAEAFADPEPFFRSALAFSETQRRHMVWENGIVLPLARKRLTKADIVDLGRAMAARRGVRYPN